jgi:hypothetical protein
MSIAPLGSVHPGDQQTMAAAAIRRFETPPRWSAARKLGLLCQSLDDPTRFLMLVEWDRRDALTL